MFGFFLSNWKRFLIGGLLLVIGILFLRLSGKDVTIQEKNVVIEKKNAEITDREAKIARVNEEVSKLKFSQEQDGRSLAALQKLVEAKDKQMVDMRVRFQKELDACYNSKEVPIGDPKVQGVLDDASNRVYVRLLNGILPPGVSEGTGTPCH